MTVDPLGEADVKSRRGSSSHTGGFTCRLKDCAVTIGLAPTIDVGPVSFRLARDHDGGRVARRRRVASWLARRRGLSPDPIWLLTLTVAVAGVAGARLFYQAQADPAGLLTPWSGGLEA